MAEPYRTSAFDSLDPRRRPNPGHAAVYLENAGDLGRLTLRGDEETGRLAAETLGLAPPIGLGSSRTAVPRMLRPGPNEWLIVADYGERHAVADRLRAVLAGRHFALVDISDRMATMGVRGRTARETLNAACPLDLHPRAFPAGSATRTTLGKAEILLEHQEEARFLVHTNRSVAAYCWRLLEEAGREFPLAADL